jgi:Holliday junction resolvase-like predicted endonuclease
MIKPWQAAENYVAEKYHQQGWEIAQRNYRLIGVEIDILGYKKGTLVAIEVKLRKNKNRGELQQLFSRHKQKRLEEGLQHFRESFTKKVITARVDLAVIFGCGRYAFFPDVTQQYR